MFGVSGPVVIAENMIGAAMYELVSANVSIRGRLTIGKEPHGRDRIVWPSFPLSQESAYCCSQLTSWTYRLCYSRCESDTMSLSEVCPLCRSCTRARETGLISRLRFQRLTSFPLPLPSDRGHSN